MLGPRCCWDSSSSCSGVFWPSEATASADDDQENHGQHDSVLSDVLSGLLGPDEAGASLRWDQPTSTRVDKEEKEKALQP
jgi:hypothetical protein